MVQKVKIKDQESRASSRTGSLAIVSLLILYHGPTSWPGLARAKSGVAL